MRRSYLFLMFLIQYIYLLYAYYNKYMLSWRCHTNCICRARSARCHPSKHTVEEYIAPVIPIRVDRVGALLAKMRGVRSTFYQQGRLLALVDLYESVIRSFTNY